MNMNLIQEIPSENLGDFKQKVKQWIELDSQIEALNKKCRENLYDWKPFEPRTCPYCGLRQIQIPD